MRAKGKIGLVMFLGPLCLGIVLVVRHALTVLSWSDLLMGLGVLLIILCPIVGLLMFIDDQQTSTYVGSDYP